MVRSPNKVFTTPQWMYVFQDDSRVLADKTKCYKFNLQELLVEYYIYDESKPFDQQETNLTEMVQNQIDQYDKAVLDLIERVGNYFNLIREKERKLMLDYNYIYLLGGQRITNLLDVPHDTCVLLISDKPEYRGVDFEDCRGFIRGL